MPTCAAFILALTDQIRVLYFSPYYLVINSAHVLNEFQQKHELKSVIFLCLAESVERLFVTQMKLHWCHSDVVQRISAHLSKALVQLEYCLKCTEFSAVAGTLGLLTMSQSVDRIPYWKTV